MRTDVRKGANAAATKRDGATRVPIELLLKEIPPASEHLNQDGIFWWDYYCGLMLQSAQLSKYFISLVHNFCMVLQGIEAFEKKITEQGYFIDVPKKYAGEEYIEEVPNPLLDKLSKMYAQADSLANSLGFSPFSSKVQNIDTGSGSNLAPSQPPSMPDDFTPETIPFEQVG
ncbi:Putative phage terminase, small subunit, P27 family [uncultured Caudovirales phage]|uniref:Phage terminase, small subunit, P27 family n=1 Tax=uncultured Caudovirales phage TaxID=2100421 RepID=A0A6J5RMX4_9CAUD|nr:Putative phage terminase, small subunit, P27 family [uncultured Caudovirales phage]CAB4182767.1 Putative phage terminase, small subunit, P27 family [uncultured Caudovirales phage]CAB4197402.1 Putative phage terminase, small subunit, P27 family [uncultured Caudovirales phage]CAB4211279.1 Putative phage terminase, small subunit, P27 family [uncultured Caudovirales phage]CAB5237965.1 Putative phage terminase, small subunit, P27 family [uncultured Caudovirales phage]